MTDQIDKLLGQLPPELQKEVADFARFLIQKKRRVKHKPLRMKWAGGLREFRKEFSSLDLQRKAMEWWGD
jgi:hypothetical protein